MIFVYRKNGGQVVSTTVNVELNTAYFASVLDPPVPDGVGLLPLKIWDGAQVRNATPAEVAAFDVAAAQDLVKQARSAAIARLQTDVEFRKILRAIVGLTVQQLNVLRANDSLAPLTETQVQNAIVNAINNGTYD